MFSFIKKSHSSFFWLSSSAALLFLSKIFAKTHPPYEGGIFYALFTLLYSLVIFILFRKSRDMAPLPPIIFWLGVLFLAMGEPLFENDHYRYLWEGKLLLWGENPYTHSPASSHLDHIFYPYRDRIAFNELTSPYPPLAIFWFGLGALFDFPMALWFMIFLNAGLVALIYEKLYLHLKPWHALALFPWVQKEFIQAIHIDLLASSFLLLWLLSFRGNSGSERQSTLKKQALILGLGLWTKILTVLALPVLFIQKNGSLRCRLFFFLSTLLSLPLFLFSISQQGQTLNGLYRFGAHWVWNPGFYTFLKDFLYFPGQQARLLSLGLYALSFVILFLKLFLDMRRGGEKPQSLYWFCYFVFSGLMFFTPVYNAWYAVWFIWPALLLKLNTGIGYALFSSWGYAYHGSPELALLAVCLTHIWFLFSLGEGLSRSRWWKNNWPRLRRKI